MRRISGIGLWDADTIESSVESFVFEEISKALGSKKKGKAGGPSGIVKEHLAASCHGMQAILAIANGILIGEHMPLDWRTSTVVPIYKRKDCIMQCGNYRGFKLLEHGMKAVERLLEKELRIIVKSIKFSLASCQEKEQ